MFGGKTENKIFKIETPQDLINAFKGQPGVKGDKGDPGRDGVDGKDGLPGLAGRPGRDGKDGRNGEPGKDGIDGKPGANGRDGKPGEPGKDGIDGINGIPGVKGDKGDPGEPGKNGAQGVKGDPGRDGVDGKDGLNGEPGKDGKNGRDAPFSKWVEIIDVELFTDTVGKHVAFVYDLTDKLFINLEIMTMGKAPSKNVSFVGKKGFAINPEKESINSKIIFADEKTHDDSSFNVELIGKQIVLFVNSISVDFNWQFEVKIYAL